MLAHEYIPIGIFALIALSFPVLTFFIDLIMAMLSKIQHMSVVRFLEARLTSSFIFSTICLLYFLSFLI